MPQVVWLYSLIVGFGIREALLDTVPIITSEPSANCFFLYLFPVIISSADQPDYLLVVVRLILYLTCAWRFLLGAINYFNDHHTDSQLSGHFQLDFASGFFHFIIFFSWGTTLARVDQYVFGPFSVGPFLAVMAVFLAYDGVWWILKFSKNVSKECRTQIYRWAGFNLILLALSALPWAFLTLAEYSDHTIETVALVPIFLGSLWDCFLQMINRPRAVFNFLLGK